MELNYWQRTWPLKVKQCPCDVHFLEYLGDHQVTDQMIFHFGSGEHHVLGKNNVELGQHNEIFAVTASRKEYTAYIDFIIQQPQAARYYKVLFADIYTLTPRMMPGCDLMTLFHLCEFYDEEQSAYAQLNDTTLLDLCLAKLNPGGKIFFYTRSQAFHKAQRIIQDFVQHGKLVQEDEYKTLLVYGRAQ